MGNFWSPFSAEASYQNQNTNQNTYGTRTPNVSPQATDAFGNIIANTGANGANAPQQTAIDWQKGNLLNNPVNAQTGQTNTLLGQNAAGFAPLNTQLSGIAGGATPQSANSSAPWYLSDINPLRSAAQAGEVPTVTAQTGAEAARNYAPLFSQSLIDPSLKAFDYGTDRAFSALDARTAGAGAFGNTRSGLGYSDLGAQSSLGRGQLEAGLLTTGLTNAINAGQTDASRGLLAQSTNAANILGRGEFNAGQTNDINKAYVSASDANAARGTQGNQFNASLGQNNNQFNVQAALSSGDQKMRALGQIATNLTSQSGIQQGILNNIVTQNGINTQAAQNLFTAGTITQSQLNDILTAAQQWNGYSYNQNQNTNQNTTKASIGIGG